MEHKQRVREKKNLHYFDLQGDFREQNRDYNWPRARPAGPHPRPPDFEGKKNENKTEERVKVQKENETSPTKLLSPEGFFCHK